MDSPAASSRRVETVAATRHSFPTVRKRGVNAKDAILTARSNGGPWRVSITAAMCWALPGAYFDSLGLPYLELQ